MHVVTQYILCVLSFLEWQVYDVSLSLFPTTFLSLSPDPPFVILILCVRQQLCGLIITVWCYVVRPQIIPLYNAVHREHPSEWQQAIEWLCYCMVVCFFPLYRVSLEFPEEIRVLRGVFRPVTRREDGERNRPMDELAKSDTKGVFVCVRV